MFKNLLVLFAVVTTSLFSLDKEEYLVCLHGFLGSAKGMRFLETDLKKDGWDVVNWGYPSRDFFIEQHGEHLVLHLIGLAEDRPGKPIHFVSHSMGGLVLLAALNHPLCPDEAKTGKVALLAPPLKGSHWGRELSRFPWARKIVRDKAGHELMTKSNFDDLGSYPESLENVLVIAGTLKCNPLLKGASDGTLLLEETYLSTPHERATVQQQHSTMLYSKKVSNKVREFFRKDN